MATLIIQHGANGKRQGQCDARCYNAKSSVCYCCCGGANHGVGLQKAISNTREMVEDLAQKAQSTGTDIRVMLPKQSRDSRGRFIKKGGD